jgi:hypothetical protein
MRKELLPMKTMALMLSLLGAGLGASFALASPGHGHGHGKGDAATSTSATSTLQARACKPTVSYVLNGTFVAAGADGSSFSMTVAHANHHAKALGASPTMSVDAKTRIVRSGKKAGLADLRAGDRLNVQARGCKGLAADSTPALVAKRVVAHPAKAAPGATTTMTTTTTTTDDEETTTATTAP